MGRQAARRRRSRDGRRDDAGAAGARGGGGRARGGRGTAAIGRRALAAIVGGAFAVRLWHVWALEASPFADLLLGDAAGYDRWARRLAAGDWLGADVFYQAPLYPYLLGVVYTLAGPDVTLVRVLQAALGAASCGLLAAAGARFVSPRVGLAAGAALALYAPAIFVEATLQKSVLDLFLLTALLWQLGATVDAGLPDGAVPDGAAPDDATRRGAGRPGTPRWPPPPPSPPRRWIGIGVLLGALCLTRENAAVLGAALAVWLWLERRARRDWARSTALIAAGAAALLLPVAARNAVVGGEWHLTTSQLGPNFYIGNHAAADGVYRPLRYGRGDPAFERDDATALAEAAAGRDLTPAEVSRYWLDRALDDIAAAPGRWLALLARKAALTVNAVEAVDTESQYAHAEHSLPLAATGGIAHFGLLVPLAVVGAAAAWPYRRRLLPLYLMLGAYAASVVAFYVFARYRYPLTPFLLLLAAAGGDRLAGLVRRTASLDRAPLVAAAALAALAAANWPLLSTDLMRAASYNNLGTAYRERGDLRTAIAQYDTALAIDPAYPQAHSNLGSALAAAGEPDRALGHYEQAVAADPETGDLRFNFGNALLAQGRFAEAAEQFRRALEAWPADVEALNNLGMALGSLGRLTEAADAFRDAVRLDPASVLAHRNLGIALEELGDAPAARRHLAEAARLDAAAAR